MRDNEVEKQQLLKAIRDSIVNLDPEKSEEFVRDALDAGLDPQEIVLESLTDGLDIVGKKFEASEYFLSELIAAAEIGKEISAMLKPMLGNSTERSLGKIAIGTVHGDLHDVGKNIVAIMLEVGGFKVIDLGTDVSSERFVQIVGSEKPDIVGMSSLLTVTMLEMKAVIEALTREGLRDDVKVIVGGPPITEEFARNIGADGYAPDAVQAVILCKALIQKRSV